MKVYFKFIPDTEVSTSKIFSPKEIILGDEDFQDFLQWVDECFTGNNLEEKFNQYIRVKIVIDGAFSLELN